LVAPTKRPSISAGKDSRQSTRFWFDDIPSLSMGLDQLLNKGRRSGSGIAVLPLEAHRDDDGSLVQRIVINKV
jgi:hypothetical protein